jgi:hypothetical protein
MGPLQLRMVAAVLLGALARRKPGEINSKPILVKQKTSRSIRALPWLNLTA